jgi:hypothetical protein
MTISLVTVCYLFATLYLAVTILILVGVLEVVRRGLLPPPPSVWQAVAVVLAAFFWPIAVLVVYGKIWANGDRH